MLEAEPHTLFLEKLRKYGVVGAGIVTLDPSDALRHARSIQRHGSAASSRSAAVAGLGTSLPEPQHPPRSSAPAGPSKELSEAIASMAREIKSPGSGQVLKRAHILEILTETARVQAIVQQEISSLARELAEAKNGKKRRKPLSFLDGHKKILELNLPREPLEEHGVPESAFQNLLLEYQEDDEVMAQASKLLHPSGKGDPAQAKGINIDRIVEIHQFMVKEMDKVLQEFKTLKQDSRHTFSTKACETTAELLVSVAVEQQLSVRCEDVEQAVMMYDEALQQHPEFTRCTEMLAHMMQLLIGCTQPRSLTRADFLEALRHSTEAAKSMRAFAKKLYEDYRAKSVGIEQAYIRFEEFHDQAESSTNKWSDISHVELQLCFDEYEEGDDEIRQAWKDARHDLAAEQMRQLLASQTGSPQAGGARPSSGPEERKGRKTKPSELVEMQELMVDELKRICEATDVAMKKGVSREWKVDLLTQLVQALASGAVERRYNVSAEDMTMMCLQHCATLQRNERFVRATEKQQELLIQRIPQLCEAANAS
jgi:hypothetical protein